MAEAVLLIPLSEPGPQRGDEQMFSRVSTGYTSMHGDWRSGIDVELVDARGWSSSRARPDLHPLRQGEGNRRPEDSIAPGRCHPQR
jgi:hypothetical protein